MPPASQASVEAVSGSLGAVVALLATYPLKTIYTLQAISAARTGVADRGALADVIDIITKYKLQGLYIGIQPNIVETAVSSGVYFYVYSLLKKLAAEHFTSHAAPAASASGGAPASTSTCSAEAAAASGAGPTTSSETTPCDAEPSDGGPLARAPTPVHLGNGNGGKAGASTSTSGSGSSPATDSHNATPRLGVMMSLTVAAVAGVINQLMTMPIGTVATRIVANEKRRMEAPSAAAAARIPVDAWTVVLQVLSEGGLPAFWNGLLPSMVLVANPAIQYMLYDKLLHALQRWRTSGSRAGSSSAAAGADGVVPEAAAAPEPAKLSAADYFLVSAAAKIGATVATFPLMVIKARLQAAGKDTAAELRYTGALDAAMRILQSEGPGGLFRGLRAKILQTALNAALMMMLKEQLASGARRVLEGGWQDVQRMAGRALPHA